MRAVGITLVLVMLAGCATRDKLRELTIQPEPGPSVTVSLTPTSSGWNAEPRPLASAEDDVEAQVPDEPLSSEPRTEDEPDVPEATATAEPEAPSSRAADASPNASWWDTPIVDQPGRTSAIASATAPTVREARTQAVDAGFDELRSKLRADPDEVRIDRATAIPTDTGFTFYVLVSCAQ